MNQLDTLRQQIRTLHLADEHEALATLAQKYRPEVAIRQQASVRAAELVTKIRHSARPTLMEVFLAEYGLSTSEGIALMCLAEALLRVPDAETVDELIEDKIAPSAWGSHLGKSSSSLVNASTWALMLTGNILNVPEDDGLVKTLHGAVRRLGEPVIRAAVRRAMKEMGHQFVLGQTITEAVKRAGAQEQKGYTYSYDMLGEAALTAADADDFFSSYQRSIEHLATLADSDDAAMNPGISIKLSALHPRYELAHRQRVMTELVPRVKELAMMAKNAGMGLNIDAEEADRLDLSLDVIQAVVSAEDFAGWDGFGVVVQAYSKRAPAVIDWLYELAGALDRQFMVRLVKGAYWDAEIKQSQVDGLSGFPVFTHKAFTDVSYLCNAHKLLQYADRIYPQFATHNAHTVACIQQMAKADPRTDLRYEFQRLHGMGESLYEMLMQEEQVRCRIYAPVGVHRDLLAYLVRRLLENGANSSFVNQIVDDSISPEVIARDPFLALEEAASVNEAVVHPMEIYQPERTNSSGWDLRSLDDIARFEAARNPFRNHQWTAGPIIHSAEGLSFDHRPVFSPSIPDDCVGQVAEASTEHLELAISHASDWSGTSAKERHTVLNQAADLYEVNAGEIFAALTREAGKTGVDAVAEIREAVDFLRYYAAQSLSLRDQHRGLITCISPWNFPLAIFTGQIAAALAAGNGVLAKPADPTPIVASIAVRLLHKAGVPTQALQLLPGEGATVGVKLTTDERINGICFTGSTAVAQLINSNASSALEPDFSFIAETGGLNAMIVDSTALPEQAIKDIVDSAFRSCGQRCSALRVLFLQSDIADNFLKMLFGAMDELEVSDPWLLSSDLGPVITDTARQKIQNHIEAARANGKLLKQLDIPDTGLFIGPAVIKVDSMSSLQQEIFGPVLHIATFEAHQIDQLIDDINASGYGLTFGLHTRIDDRVERITSRLNVGNIYVNRNQIGAIVGSQPFGGEGLSGTGPKAGGPQYLPRFTRHSLPLQTIDSNADPIDPAQVQACIDALDEPARVLLESVELPGPTGESNRLSTFGRGVILCLGPSVDAARLQMQTASRAGCQAVAVVPGIEGEHTLSGYLDRQHLSQLRGIDAVALWSDKQDLRAARIALADREGPLLPLISTDQMHDYCLIERHLCIDTTAAGGNASLLAAQ